MANAASKVAWLHNLLTSLGFSVPLAIMHCYNQIALHIATNPVFHELTKHIEVDCHFVHKKLVFGILITYYTPTKEQLAEIFMKAFGQRQFHYLLSKLGVTNPHTPT